MRIALKISLHAVTAVTALLLALIWLCALPSAAFAYVDPSVMTYTIQALAGVAVALSAVLGVAARRTRAFLLKLLEIDENRKRVTDDPVYRLDAQGSPIIPVQAANEQTEEATSTEAAPKKKRKLPRWLRKLVDAIPVDRRPYKPSWKERLIFALIASAFAIGTVFIMAPLEIIGGSAGSLVFSFKDIWWIAVLPSLGLIAVLTLVLSLFPGRLFSLLLAGVASLGLCAYVQSLFLNIGVPIADGGTLVWGDHAFMMAVCTVVWTAIIVVCVVGSQVNVRRSQGIIGLAGVALLLVQTVGVASLIVSPPEPTGGDPDGLTANALTQAEAIATEDGLFTVSSKDNVIVFVLDTYDTVNLHSLLNSDPRLLDDFTGFTCFNDVTGSMIPTHYAIPALISGELPREGEPFSTYVDQRYARSTLLSDLNEAGYSVGLYSDSLCVEDSGTPEEQYKNVVSKTMNIHSVSSSTIDFRGTLEALWQMALYRDVPWSMKSLFWYYTDQINKAMVSYNPDADPGDTVYIIDDVRYYNQLCNKGLSLDEDDATTAGAFRFIHLLGPHYPYSYDENAHFVGTDQSTLLAQAKGALHIVAEYLNQLKAMGLYDKATVIVTADHGIWRLTNEDLTGTSCPILMAKPSQTAEEASAPAVLSDAPVSHADIHETIRQSMNLKPGSTGGLSVYDVINSGVSSVDRTRLYYTTNTVTRRETAIVEYAIKGDAEDIKNWTKTGVTWDPAQ